MYAFRECLCICPGCVVMRVLYSSREDPPTHQTPSPRLGGDSSFLGNSSHNDILTFIRLLFHDRGESEPALPVLRLRLQERFLLCRLLHL